MNREQFRQEIRDVLREYARTKNLTQATDAISAIAINTIACGSMQCPVFNLHREIADDLPSSSTELVDIDRGDY